MRKSLNTMDLIRTKDMAPVHTMRQYESMAFAKYIAAHFSLIETGSGDSAPTGVGALADTRRIRQLAERRITQKTKH